VSTPEGATHWAPPAATSIVLSSAAVPKRSRPTRLIGAAVGGFAVLVAGAFALRAVTADDGGAASPEAAAQAFFDALADEDLIGAMDAVLPGEQAAFRDPLLDLVSELRRLEIAGEDADASAVAGIDIEFPELSFRELPTNVEDITNVEVDGLATIVVDATAIPLGDLVLDLVGDVEEAEQFEGSDPIEDYVFTTVREDGGWYVSLGYTLAERARWGEGADAPADSPEIPSIEAAVQPRGGETPEDGMDRMLDAVEDLDLEGVLATLDPNEFAPLHRYAPLFLDDAQAELDDAAAEVDFSIEDREYEVVADGSTARLTLSSATLTVSAEGNEIEVEFGDGCLRVSGSNMETEEVCADDVAEGAEVPTLDDFGLPTEELGALGETVSEAFEDFEGAGITMTQVDGEWFVSPIGTMTDTMLAVMRALDRAEIDEIGAAASEAVDAFFSDFEGSFSDPFGEDSFGTDDGFDSGPDSFAEYYRCVEDFDDAVERAQCFEEGIAAGTIDDYLVTPQERFPACGLAQYYENGFADYSALSDEDFIALFTEAQACFEGLVASGDIDSFVGVPLPLRDISCYEGRNPEAIVDVDERFDVQGEIFDCLLAAD
jgi:hypothetical protein